MVAAQHLVVNDISAQVGVADDFGGRFGAFARFALCIGQHGAGFTHGLSEAIDTFLSREKFRADCVAALVGNDKVVRTVDVDDLSAVRRNNYLVVLIVAAGVVAKGAVLIHLADHLGNDPSGLLESTGLKFDQEAIDQARPIRVAVNRQIG